MAKLSLALALVGGAALLLLVYRLIFAKTKAKTREKVSVRGRGNSADTQAPPADQSAENDIGEFEFVDIAQAARRGCAAYIEPHKVKHIFVIVTDPLQNNQTKMAKLVQSIYQNAHCPAGLSVAVVTSTVPETQRKVEQLVPVHTLANIALSYVEVYHPCSVDQAVAAAVEHAYRGEQFIATMRPVIRLAKEWDLLALKQFHALCPLRSRASVVGGGASVGHNNLASPTSGGGGGHSGGESAPLPRIVLSGITHDAKHAMFPAFSGWTYPRRDVVMPAFRWVRFATVPDVAQPSAVFTSAFSFGPATVWTRDAVPDIHLEALTPTVSDWLYSCRLHSIACEIYTPAQPIAALHAEVAAPHNTGGAERLIEWFATPFFLDAAAERTGIDSYGVTAEWRAHAGLLKPADDDEILYKYGTLAAAERTMKTLRAQITAQSKSTKRSSKAR